MTDTKSEIEALEQEIVAKKKRLAELLRAQPRQRVEDYALETWTGPARLSELFGDKEDLLVIHNMGKGCLYCTLWADGFNGVVPHLEDRTAFVVVSPDEPHVQREFATSRGWRFKMASDLDRQFTKAMGMWVDDSPWPGITGFRKLPDGAIERIGTRSLGEGDDFCAVWHMFDLLADGWNGWEPKPSY